MRWFPAMVSNHVKDLIDRYGTDGSVVPKALTDYVRGTEVLRLQRALARRRQARRVRDRRDLRPLLACSARVEQATAKLRELEAIGVDQFSIYLMTHGQEETLAAYGERIIPAFKGVAA